MLSPKNASLFSSAVLIIIGLSGYFIKLSATALIPVVFGVILIICYLLYEKNNKVIAHIAVSVTLLVFISLFMPLSKRFAADDINGILRIVTMQLVSLYSIACFVLSFIKARKDQ